MVAEYRRVADDLAKRITSGEFAGTGKMPSHTELRETYGLGQTTIQRALVLLVEWGLVEHREGLGYWVV